MAKRRIKRILTYSERRKRVRQRRLILLFFFVLLLIGIIVGIIYCIRLDTFRVNSIEVQGASDDNKGNIKKEVEHLIDGNKYFFMPNDGMVFISTDKISEILRQKFSYIQDVKTEKDYPRSLKVTIQERAPRALYCDSRCYFIDQTGLIYAPASDFSPGVYMIYEDKTMDSSPPILSSLTDEDTFKELENYYDEIKKLGLDPIKASFITSWEIQIDNRDNGYILINLERPYDETVQNLRTVFLQGVKKFQYIDARYGNKIFYK